MIAFLAIVSAATILVATIRDAARNVECYVNDPEPEPYR